MYPESVRTRVPFTKWLTLILLLGPATISRARSNDPHPIPPCGEVKVHLSHPEYLTTAEGLVIAEPALGWVLDKTKNGPFFFVRTGENYSTARTVMYINVEHLEVPFNRAVQNDWQSFQRSCPQAEIQDLSRLELLEEGCESRTQILFCRREKNPYVDLVTKIAIGGSLLNVVLSADTAADVSRYKADYNYLLTHVTMIH